MGLFSPPAGKYAPVSASRPGGGLVALGDSITAGATDNPNSSLGESWPLYASVTSQQRLHMLRNAGVFGNKTADMLARFDTDVTPYAPRIVTILAGTNDIGNAVPFATFRANIAALVAKVYAIGAVPVLVTIPPRATYEMTVEAWNAWLRDYAERNGLPGVLDFHRLLTDPATNRYSATYDSGDGIHPNAAGYAALGELVAWALAPLVPHNSPLLPVANANSNNLLANGLFITDGNADGIADSWTQGSNPTGTAKTLVSDTGIAGNFQRITGTNASGLYVLNQDVTTGWSVGDTLRFCGVVSNDGGSQVTIHITFTGSSAPAPRPIATMTKVVNRGVFCQDNVVPTGTTAVRFGLECGAASATYVASFAQCAIWNLTTMGTLL